MTDLAKNPCTICGVHGIPGLLPGAGKCQYHWNVGAFGQEWADKIRNDFLYTMYAEQQRGYGWTPLDREGWERSGRADRARKHYHDTGYYPGQYIGPQAET